MTARNWTLLGWAMTLLCSVALAEDQAGLASLRESSDAHCQSQTAAGGSPGVLRAGERSGSLRGPHPGGRSRADLEVRAWRFSYNARGIIEMPNRLRGDKTALIVVHPWGIDDGQGWRTPEPAGTADFCTPVKNDLSHEHIVKVLNPFLKQLRGKVRFLMYSQPGNEDPIRKKIYRSFRGKPTEARARARATRS